MARGSLRSKRLSTGFVTPPKNGGETDAVWLGEYPRGREDGQRREEICEQADRHLQ